MKFKTTTPKGTEGFNISYSDEKRCADALKNVLPKGWTASFSWAQILFSDVQYEVDKKKKVLRVVYNRNLAHWWPECIKEIRAKVA